ncbi:gluconeogenesis factor YvcK family protein [Candidatus Chloroploca sp. Khr17]|uniref:gluconeogenesis factor YvcK family protein n=1 Tax=Candidatus Chloroploca sp. Khr17 TaxID=2496869 RepID=UPI00101BC89B|nr:gluconeogenesis factor YvcK family protein [Candidatus Chloroploca sp. Khr17]
MTNGIDEGAGFKLVAIGGGGGVSQILQGMLPYHGNLTGVIAVTDTGRSTGIARELGGIPAPGDLRNTLAKLARDPDDLLARLMQYRFVAPTLPTLDGMAFGNLLIAALAQMTGDFGQAITIISSMLACRATILPVATVDAHLCAELADGSLVETELAVRGLNKPPLARLFLKPASAPANPAVLAAISEADLIVLGPGSFFTSVLASLLFDGMIDALRTSKARIVFVCNTTTQPGQTDGMNVYAHIDHLVALLGPGTLTAALINRSEDLDPAILAPYAAEGVHLLEPDDQELARIAARGVTPLVRNLTETPSGKRELWNKQDTIRHDPALIGMALWKLILDQRL